MALIDAKQVARAMTGYVILASGLKIFLVEAHLFIAGMGRSYGLTFA